MIAAACEGYAFPTNLDKDPPIGGLAPASQADIVRTAVAERWPIERLRAEFAARNVRRAGLGQLMPEGDTLRRLADRINERFAGAARACGRSTRDPRIATVDFGGRVLVDADAYGKHLFVRFDDGRTLHAHLLMTGSFEVGRVSREPEWKRRVELWLDSGRLTGVAVPLLDVIADRRRAHDHRPARPGPVRPRRTAGHRRRHHAARPRPRCAACRRAARPAQRRRLRERLRQRPAVHRRDQPVSAGRLDRRTRRPGRDRHGADPAQRRQRVRSTRPAASWAPATTGSTVPGRGRCPVCGSVAASIRDADSTPWQRSITWCGSCQPLVAGRRRRSTSCAPGELVALHPAVARAVLPDDPQRSGDGRAE